MKRNFEFDSDEYLDEVEGEEIELHFKRGRQRRTYDARRKIERHLENKRMRKIMNYDDFQEVD